MKTIILPGYLEKNREWADDVKKNLDLDGEIVVHHWEHWSGLKSSLNPKSEVKQILETIGGEKINIIAKSVGTRVTMHLIPEIKNQIRKVILCGIPTRFESDKPRGLYKKGLTLLSPTQVEVFQNEKDPLANFSVVEKFIHLVNSKIKVRKMPRSDHHYPYYEQFSKCVKPNNPSG